MKSVDCFVLEGCEWFDLGGKAKLLEKPNDAEDEGKMSPSTSLLPICRLSSIPFQGP